MSNRDNVSKFDLNILKKVQFFFQFWEKLLSLVKKIR